MKFPLFAALKKKREFEKLRMPFIGSLLDFDIVIEIGYAQERRRVITPKQLVLMELGSVTTVRRRLAKLTEQGVVSSRANSKDHRSRVLTLSAPAHKLFEKYGGVLLSFA